MFRLIQRLYDKKIDASGLAFFRVAYFLVLFGELAQLFYFKELVFDVIPFVQPYELDFTWAFYAWFVVIFLLIIGLFTRTAAIANYLFTLVFLSTISSFEYHVFYTYTTVNFFCLFLPISKRFSIDRLLLKLKYSNTRTTYEPPKTTTVLSYTLPLLVAVAFVYADSMLYKVTSKFWMQGLGVWYPAAFPQASITSSSSLGGFLINNYYLTKFFGYLTLVFETSFIFLFWFRRFRVPLLIIGLGLHIGILITFPIPWFALAVAATYILLVPVAWYRQLAAWLHRNNKTLLTVYYDEECPLCQRAKIAVKHFDIFSKIKFKGVQSNQTDEAIANVPLDDLLDNIYAVQSNGKVQHGIDTYIQILFKMRYTALFGLLLKIPGIYHLAKALYQYVAANRNVERCTEGNCGYQITVLPQDKDAIKLLQNLTVKKLRVFLIGAGMLFICLLQIGISYNSDAIFNWNKKTGWAETTVGQHLYDFSNELDAFALPVLGLTHHPVFMDNHFNWYTHIVSIVYVGEDGAEERLPIIGEDGSPQYYIYGPNWVKWTFRVNSPMRINEDLLKDGIQDFTAFWAYKNGVQTNKATFRIDLKLIDMPNKFEADFLEKQRQKPWETLGKAVWENNKFSMELDGKYQYLF